MTREVKRWFDKKICNTPEECDQLAKELVLEMLRCGLIKIPQVEVFDTKVSIIDPGITDQVTNNATFLHHLMCHVSEALKSERGERFTESKTID